MDRCQEILGIAEKFQANWEEGAEKRVSEPLFLSVMDVLRKFGSEKYSELEESLYRFVNLQRRLFIHYFQNLLTPIEISKTPPPPPAAETPIPVTTDQGPPLPLIGAEKPQAFPIPTLLTPEKAPSDQEGGIEPAPDVLPETQGEKGEPPVISEEPIVPMPSELPPVAEMEKVEPPSADPVRDVLPAAEEVTPFSKGLESLAQPELKVPPQIPTSSTPLSLEPALPNLEDLGEPVRPLVPLVIPIHPERGDRSKVLPPFEPVLPEGLVLPKDPSKPRPKEPVFPGLVQEGSPSPGGLDDLVQPEFILPPQIEPPMAQSDLGVVEKTPKIPELESSPINLLDDLGSDVQFNKENIIEPAPGANPDHAEGEAGSPERLVELARDFYLTPLPPVADKDANEALMGKDSEMVWLENLFYPDPDSETPPPTEVE
jgi:hypothetical protein